MGPCSAPIYSLSFRFWGSATSGRLGRVTVLPQLKIDRLCSVLDGTADFDPKWKNTNAVLLVERLTAMS